ncbi:hypothetical protein DRQ29_02245, partial [bacterium]
TAAGGTLRFDDRYLYPASAVELPPNTPPVARIRPPVSIVAGEPALFLALGSYDPDGSIVLYHWKFGDRSGSETRTNWSVEHTFKRAGVYEVTLIVVDDRGGMGKLTLRFPVVEPTNEPVVPPSSGCGCGK